MTGSPTRSQRGDSALPPLAASAASPAGRSGASASECLAAEASLISRSALSGSSKTPFPPDRSFLSQDFTWTRQSR